jgi:hypothetical protein
MLLSVGLVTNVVDVEVKDVNAVASEARDWEKYLGEK